MPQTILLKKSSVANKVPTNLQLVAGELAVNTNDGVLYTLKGTTVVEIGASTITGDVTGSISKGAGSLTLANSGVTAGTYNNVSTQITPFTVDAKGRITSTGSPVTVTSSVSALSDVVLTSPSTGNILQFDGTNWVNVAGSSSNLFNYVVINKASGYGIKVDTATPTWGWHDIIGAMVVRGGSSAPAWNTYRGAVSQYQFAVNDELTFNYHIPHDWAPGTDIFIHVHWSLNVSGVSETVSFTAYLTEAKGFNQAAFTAPVSVTWVQASSTIQYQHMIAEVQITGGSLIPLANLEVDSLILSRIVVSANTGSSQPFIHSVDLHYQSTNIATKNKAPSFYA